MSSTAARNAARWWRAMGNYILGDAKLYWEGHDFSGRLTSIALALAQEAKDDTTFSSTPTQTFLPGLKSHSLAYSGYHDNATVLDPDKYIEDEYGSAGTIVTVSHDGGQIGERAWSMYCNTSEYTPVEGDVGDVAGFSFDSTGTGKMFMGIIMENGQETSSATGTGREIYGLDDTDVAYMVIHCTELDATTLDIIVESDTVTTMDDSASERDFSQVQFTAVGAQYLTYTAASDLSADDCWRISSTISGGNTTATYTVSLYIPA